MDIVKKHIVDKAMHIVVCVIKLVIILGVIWFFSDFISTLMISKSNIGVKIGVILIPTILLLIITKPEWSFKALLFSRPLTEPLWKYSFMHFKVLGIFSFTYILIAAYMVSKRDGFKVYCDKIKWFYFLIVIIVVTATYSMDIQMSLIAVAKYFTLLSLFLLGYNVTKNLDDALRITRLVIISSIIPIIYGIYQAIMGLGVQQYKGFQVLAGVKRINSTFNLSNGFAFFLAMIIILCLFYFYHSTRKSEKVFCLSIITASLYCLLKTHVRSVWIALFISFCFLSIFKKDFRKFFLISLIIVLPLAFNTLYERFTDLYVQPEYGYNSLDFRSKMTSQLVNNALPGRFLQGYGIGTASEVVEKFTSYTTVPHNDFMRMLIETGLSGLFVYIVFLYKVFHYLISSMRKKINYNANSVFLMMMIFYLIMTMGQNIIPYISTSGYIFCFMGIIIKLNEIAYQAERPVDAR